MLLIRKKKLRKKKKHVENMFESKEKFFPYYFKRKKELKKKTNFINQQVENRKFALILNIGGWMGKNPFKSLIRTIKWYAKNKGLTDFKYRLFKFPDFVLTKKPKEIRMGKGKGRLYYKVARIVPNTKLIEFSYTKNSFSLIKLLNICKKNLPLKPVLLKNNW